MQRAIQQFNEFLTGSIDDVVIEMYDKAKEKLKNDPDHYITMLDQIIKIYKNTSILDLFISMSRIRDIITKKVKEDILLEEEIFTRFDIFSRLLKESTLNYKDKLKVFEYFMEKVLNRLSKDHMNIAINEDLVKKSNIDEVDFLNFLKHEPVKEEKNERDKEYIELLNKYNITTEKARIIIGCFSIKSHFLNKRNSFNETDLKITLMAFEVLNISQSLIIKVQRTLTKELKERSKEEKSREPVIVKKEQKKRLSQKEYNHKFHRVQELYDIQQQTVIKPLVLDEIVELISLLYELNVDEKEIIKCIQTINKYDLAAYKNPIAEFNDYYEKMMFCSEDPNIRETQQNIKDYLQEIFIPSDNSSYLFWKQAIDDEMKKAHVTLKENYQYELEKAKEKIKH